MCGRRAIVGAAVAVLAVSAGLVLPADAAPLPELVVTPQTVELHGTVTISNDADGPCGADPDDPPAVVDVEISNPDHAEVANDRITPDADGSWRMTFTDTDVPGEYVVFAYCGINVTDTTVVLHAVDIGYATTTFVVQAPPPTTPLTLWDPIVPIAPAPVIADPNFTG